MKKKIVLLLVLLVVWIALPLTISFAQGGSSFDDIKQLIAAKTAQAETANMLKTLSDITILAGVADACFIIYLLAKRFQNKKALEVEVSPVKNDSLRFVCYFLIFIVAPVLSLLSAAQFGGAGRADGCSYALSLLLCTGCELILAALLGILFGRRIAKARYNQTQAYSYVKGQEADSAKAGALCAVRCFVSIFFYSTTVPTTGQSSAVFFIAPAAFALLVYFVYRQTKIHWFKKYCLFFKPRRIVEQPVEVLVCVETADLPPQDAEPADEEVTTATPREDNGQGFTAEEESLVAAYRDKPAMREAVKKMLDF